MKLARLCIGALLVSLALPALSSNITYILGDHPDGNLYDGSTSGPNGPYGLRLDGIDPPAGSGPTFSVGDNLGGNGGLVTLTWDTANLAGGANISGTLFRNDDGSSWTVDYNLSGLMDDGNGGWTASAGTGSLTEIGGPGAISLTGKTMDGKAFVFANDGFRLSGQDEGFVGRGWLDDNLTNDWLVTAVIPLPAGIWLFGSALLGFAGWARRKVGVAS